jgi:hypothetical protein
MTSWFESKDDFDTLTQKTCLGYMLSSITKTQAPAIQQNRVSIMYIRVLIVPWFR